MKTDTLKLKKNICLTPIKYHILSFTKKDSYHFTNSLFDFTYRQYYVLFCIIIVFTLPHNVTLVVLNRYLYYG